MDTDSLQNQGQIPKSHERGPRGFHTQYSLHHGCRSLSPSASRRACVHWIRYAPLPSVSSLRVFSFFRAIIAVARGCL